MTTGQLKMKTLNDNPYDNEKILMIEIVDKEHCSGCGACFSSCANKAISMQYDNEGFEYPVINQDACVDCGLCQANCPVINFDFEKRKIYSKAQLGYAARNRNLTQRLVSSSGSIFPPIAEWILEQGGIVVGTAYDDDFNAKHLIVEKKEDIRLLQGSKYLQCKADYFTFKRIRNELKTGRLVLYSGMACQVEGLKSYLRKEYENLYTIDLICMGIPSPKVWQIYLKTFFKGEEIKHVNFKEKSVGWDSFCFHVETDKQSFKENGMRNLYLQSMFRSWNMRISCFNCPFKNAERLSDFTLADCWGAYKLVPEINDNKGLSSVIVHSEKGLGLWEKLQERIESRELPIEVIAAGNSNLIKNKLQAGNRKLFYELLDSNPRKAFVKMCTVKEPDLTQRIISKLKNIFKK